MTPTGRRLAGEGSPEGPRPPVIFTTSAVDALRELDPEDQLSVLQRMERLARSGASEGDLTGTLSRHEYDYVVVEGYAVVYRGMTHAELIAQGYERLASRGLVVLAVVQLSQIAEFLPQTSD